jgi:hypothetical protein
MALVMGVVMCALGSVLGTMTTKVDVLAQLRSEWRYVGRTNDARRALEVLNTRHPDLNLGSMDDLCDVVRSLERGGGKCVLERAEIVRALLEESENRELQRTLLQTLIPGIVSVCRQLRFGDGIISEPSETLTVALALASELIVDWAGQSRQYAAPDLLSALRGRLRRWLLKEKAALGTLSYDNQLEEPASENSPLLTRLASFEGSPYERLARLTYGRVFEGRSIHELAHQDCSAPRSLQVELRQFATHHLL